MNKEIGKVLEGKLDASGLKFGIVCARFNEFFVSKLLGGAVDSIVRLGGDAANITVAWVPGSNEIPIVAQNFAQSKSVDAVIALGVVIQGATPHASLITAEVNKALAQVALDTGVPVINAVLATNNIEQAIERSGTKAGNRGADAAATAVEMVNLLREVRK
jgi:6,7-dimethyl-8-ribityllumazine synthase